MKPQKKISGVLAGTLAISGIATLAITGSAEAAQTATQTFATASQVNNTGLSGVANRGNQAVTMTVSPGNPVVGAPITVTVSSSTLAFTNGPAAIVDTQWSEIDAVIAINGTDYILRGSRNTIAAPANQQIFASGWSVSSTAGSSAASTTNANGTGAGTGGVGAVLRSTLAPVTLTAPAAAGTYGITLKAIINNSVSNVAPASGGTGTVALTDSFDEIYNTDTANVCASANTAVCAGDVGPGGPTGSFALDTSTAFFNFTTPVDFTAVGPTATVTASTGQNANTAAIRLPLPAFTGYNGGPTVVTLGNGANFDNTGTITAELCNAAGTTCDAPGAPYWTVTSTIAADGAGGITGSLSLQRDSFFAGAPPAPAASVISTGSRAIKLTQGSKIALVPVNVLATPTITNTPANGGPGTVVSVSGSNFNPAQSVTIQGYINGTPNWGSGTGTAPSSTSSDAAVTVTATGTGGFVQNYTVVDSATIVVRASQGDGTGLNQGGNRAFAAYSVNKDRCIAATGNPSVPEANPCRTEQNVQVTVTAGRLTQRAYATGTNINSTSIGLGSLPVPQANTNVVGDFNLIQVSDNRGGATGWTLSAAVTVPLTSGTNTIAAGNMSIGTTCTNATTAATPATPALTDAKYYDGANSGLGIPGFDPALNASGITASGGTMGGTINLCTKTTATNTTTQSSGGVYNVAGPLTVTVPAFKAAGVYTGTIQVTLA